MVSVVKMATVLKECTTQEQRSLVRFSLWAKGLNAKDIHEEMFPVSGVKRFTTGCQTFR
jgi:hypothetical protein